MVRIDSTGSIGKVGKVGKARSAERARSTSKAGGAGSARGASFSASLSELSGAEAVEALDAEAALTEVAGDIGLLALQERGGGVRDGGEGARSRAIAYGEGLIERLQALHVRLLSGIVSESELLRLEVYFGEMENEENEEDAVEDEGLRSILAEIELRVQVELAKKRR